MKRLILILLILFIAGSALAGLPPSPFVVVDSVLFNINKAGDTAFFIYYNRGLDSLVGVLGGTLFTSGDFLAENLGINRDASDNDAELYFYKPTSGFVRLMWDKTAERFILEDSLKIEGTLSINDAFRFPIVDGSVNQGIKTDGSGNLFWGDDAGAGGGETNTLVDTGTFNGTEGFGLKQTKISSELRIRGLIEGAFIEMGFVGDTGIVIQADLSSYFDSSAVVDTILSSLTDANIPNNITIDTSNFTKGIRREGSTHSIGEGQMLIDTTNNVIKIKESTAGSTLRFPASEQISGDLTMSIAGVTNISTQAIVGDDVDSTSEDFVFSLIDFTLLNGAAEHKEGRMSYDSSSHSHVVYNEIDGMSGNVMREHWTRVKNVTGATIADGKAVYFSGGTGDLPHIWLAQADDTSTAKVKGLVTYRILDDSIGYITPTGEVHGINVNTTDFDHGDDLFLSEDTAGAWVTAQPEICIPIGSVERAHASTGVILVSLGHTLIDTTTVYGLDSYVGARVGDTANDLRSEMPDTANIRYDSAMAHLDGMAYDKPAITLTDSSGAGIFARVDRLSDGGDMNFRYNGRQITLDCTPDAIVQLTEGTQFVSKTNYLYVRNVGGTITLLASETLPIDSFCYIGKVVVNNIATFQADGAPVLQRYTEAFNNDSRGTESHLREKVRELGAQFVEGSGGDLTLRIVTNGGVPDSVHLEMTAAMVRQLHRQDWPAWENGPYFHGNGDSVDYKILDLNQILSEIDGTSLSGTRFNIVVWGEVDYSTSTCRLYANKPNGSYNNTNQAIADRNNTSDYTVPANMRSAAFLIARLTLRHQTGSGGTWTALNVQSLLGTPLGARSGGATSIPASNDFSDSDFRIFDNNVETKQIAFEASSISASTVRTLTVQDADGTIALADNFHDSAKVLPDYVTIDTTDGGLFQVATNSLDSTHIADGDLSIDDINWRKSYIYLEMVHGWNRALEDTILLSFPVHNATSSWLFTDSSGDISTSQSDTIVVSGYIPFGCTIDSVFYLVQTDNATADSNKVDAVEFYTSDISDGTFLADSSHFSDATDRSGTSWAVIGLDITDYTVTPGERFALRFITAFGNDNQSVRVGWVKIGYIR